MVTVGELLNKERLKKGLTLKQIEKEMRVRERLLIAIEQNDWEKFSSKIYITGLIKNYANYLGLDPNKMLMFFRRDYEKKEDIRFKKHISANYLKPETKKIIYLALGVILLVFFIYFSYQLKMFFSPPVVTLLSPIQNHFRSVESIKIVGKTENEANITILGEKVYPNKDGVFEYVFPLRQKNNELVIEVTGANGKKTTLKKVFIRD